MNHTHPPVVGFGTYKFTNKSVLAHAIRHGYRHIDCAYYYDNEAMVGEAISEALSDPAVGVTRADLWVTGKLWCNFHRPDLVEHQIRESLRSLKLDYLDLFLVHWPVAFKHVGDKEFKPTDADGNLLLDRVPLHETWRAMERLVEKKLTRFIGVSNYSVPLINDLLSYAEVRPIVNQIEVHPYNHPDTLIDYCMKQGIAVTAYFPLGGGPRSDLLTNHKLMNIAFKRGVTVAEVILAWHHCKHGHSPLYAVIPKTSSPARAEANFNAQSIELTQEEIAEVDSLEHGQKLVSDLAGFPAFA